VESDGKDSDYSYSSAEIDSSYIPMVEVVRIFPIPRRNLKTIRPTGRKPEPGTKGQIFKQITNSTQKDDEFRLSRKKLIYDLRQ